jgi:SulP family sulfate permease
MSAIDAVHKLTERYAKREKTPSRYLSADCRQLLLAATMILTLISLGPTYKVVSN